MEVWKKLLTDWTFVEKEVRKGAINVEKSEW